MNFGPPNADSIALGPWSFCRQPADDIQDPDQLRAAAANWQPAIVPGTVASSLRALGQWDLSQSVDVDGYDWWYRTSFVSPSHRGTLNFDGLATLAQVWLNGKLILCADNMFRSHRVDVDLESHNELVIVFRSLTKYLAQVRGRPKWKTNLVSQQQLRWARTSLLGRIPGWTPPVAPAGPWRGIRIEAAAVNVQMVRLISEVHGNVGRVSFRSKIRSESAIRDALLVIGQHETQLQVSDGLVSGAMEIADPPLWWPHTHGDQPLVEATLEITTGAGSHRVSCGKIGFRKLDVNQNVGFAVVVNDVPIYCRGACWTIADIVNLDGTPAQLEHDLRLARDAGVNMLRVGGTMIYESDRFYEICDQLGILVWQDFMFANMDYPADDATFADNIDAEATEQIQRLAKHPSVAVYCGNSEIEQQAAMLGMPREVWRNRFFGERLPALCAEHHPGSAYIPSTPSGGTLPFHVGSGITHFYGVGAYLRPISEVRRADVKFTAECLGFSNVPEPETVNLVMGGGPIMPHAPRWKQRVPRDTGPGWDFEDVRDHYLTELFGLDPVKMRSFDIDRYLRLSRIVTGEVMTQVFSEWRSGHSKNGGGLVWFYKDLWPGAGWGIVDGLGLPKAVYYYLKRVWQPRQIVITDEGLDGLHLHVINETTTSLRGYVELVLMKQDHVVVARSETPCDIEPRSQQMWESDALLGGFYDVVYAYRFGPPKHDVVIATLLDETRRVLGEAFHFVERREPTMLAHVAIETEAEPGVDGAFEVRLKTDRLLRAASVDAKGFLPSDNYFNLVPGREKKVKLRPLGANDGKLKAYLEAINLAEPVRIPLKKKGV